MVDSNVVATDKNVLSSSPERVDLGTPVLQTTADGLMVDYLNNEIGADSKYKNKVIKVSGIIGDISKDILGTPYVTLNTNDSIHVVQCMFERSLEGKLLNLRKGQEINLIGRISGKMGNVILRDCSF